MVLHYDTHCSARRVATPGGMYEQRQAIHREPLLQQLVDADSLERLWWATLQLQWSYSFKYSKAAYGGGATPRLIPRRTNGDQCSECLSKRTGLDVACEYCDVTSWALATYRAVTGNPNPSEQVRGLVKMLIFAKEYPATATATATVDVKSLTVAVAQGRYEPTSQYQIHDRLYTVTTAYPFDHQQRVEALRFMGANARWLDMGFHHESYVSFYVSMIEWVFRYGFALTTAYAGNAVCRRIRVIAGVDDDSEWHVCRVPSACYRCQLVQQYVNHARSFLVPKEWERVKSVVWNETKRVFHSTYSGAVGDDGGDDLLSQMSHSFTRRFADVSEAIQRREGGGGGATAAAAAAAATATTAASTDLLPLPPVDGLIAYAYDAKVSTAYSERLAAAVATLPAAVLDSINPIGSNKKRKASAHAAAAAAVNDSIIDHRLPDNIRKAIRDLDGSTRMTESGKWNCILRFPMTELVRSHLPADVLRPYWEEYVLDSVLKFVKAPVFDYKGLSAPWPVTSFTPTEIAEARTAVADDTPFLVCTRRACAAYKYGLVENPSLLLFHSILKDQPRMRLLDSLRYSWKTVVPMMAYLPAVFSKYKQTHPAEYYARWADPSNTNPVDAVL